MFSAGYYYANICIYLYNAVQYSAYSEDASLGSHKLNGASLGNRQLKINLENQWLTEASLGNQQREASLDNERLRISLEDQRLTEASLGQNQRLEASLGMRG